MAFVQDNVWTEHSNLHLRELLIEVALPMELYLRVYLGLGVYEILCGFY